MPKKLDITFKLPGRVASKKNSKRLIRAGGRTIPISSKAFARYQALTIPFLWTQMKALTKKEGILFPLDEPLRVVCGFIYTGNEPDGDNAQSAIWDILQKAGVITDDGLIIEWEGGKTRGEEAMTYVTIQNPLI